MKITFETVASQQSYHPQPGFKYEIAEGVWGVMRRPTARLVQEVESMMDAPDDEKPSDLDVAKVVLSGLPEEIDEDTILWAMPTAAVADFFTMLRVTMLKPFRSSNGFGQSELANAQPE